MLTETCVFAGHAVEPLPIIAALRAWLLKDLAQYRIPLDQIDQAELTAALHFTFIDWDERVTASQFFLPGDVEARSGPMHRCEVRCASIVRSGVDTYHGKYHDTEGWPVDWPPA